MIVPGILEQDRRSYGRWRNTSLTTRQLSSDLPKDGSSDEKPYPSLRISVENAVRNELTSLGAIVAPLITEN